MNEALLMELQQEAKTTRTVLERVPADHLTWKPHHKSMSLGQLAMHIARLPGAMSRISQLPEFDVSNANSEPPQPASTDEFLAAFDQGLADATACVRGLTPESAMAPWRLVLGEKELFQIPRAAMLRTLLYNHLIHHRGQLSVYLRLLDVPVPIIYGSSADEKPLQ